MSAVTGIESKDYDPLGDVNKLLKNPSSLNQLTQHLNIIDSYKRSIDLEISKHNEAHKEHQQSPNRFNPTVAHAKLAEIIQDIQETKKLGADTQNVITDMTSSIKKLDEAKKNLVLTMTVLKRLQMLINANKQLEYLVEQKKYDESKSLLSAVDELIDHFKTYKSIDQVAELTKRVNQMKIKLADQIFEDFELVLQRREHVDEIQLKSACDILDILGLEYHDRLITWFCNNQLKEIKEIFSSTDEAGSLENLPRRYIFFKRVLKTYEQNYISIFPESWNVEEELTLKFCLHTKQGIKNLLSTSGKNTNVDILLSSLQQTLDFEGYLNNHFRFLSNKSKNEESNNSSTDELKDDVLHNKRFSQSIAPAFEPFLGIWVDHQNTFLNSKFLEFLSAPKLPEESQTSHQPNVIPSSADLFRSYRHLLTQCSSLSNGTPLRDLSKLFSKWSIEYANRILTPTLPPKITDEEGIIYVTLVLNTADYCSSTISQLEERLVELIEEEYKDSINFDAARDKFIKLINKSLNLLISKIETENEFSWREMANTNWSHLEDVGDQSRYIVSLKETLNKNFKDIIPRFSRDLYVRNLSDKVVETTVNQFLASLVKTKPIPVVAAEQMLLDLSVLKEVFLKLPQQGIPTDSYKISASYQKHVDKSVNKLEVILKVLLTQDAPQDVLVSNYIYLIGDKSIENFHKILQLKGITDLHKVKKFNELFKIHLKTQKDLVDSSPILDKLIVEPTNSQHPSSTGLLSVSSFKSPDIPTSPRFDSILKKDNLEKGFKELAINGEASVNKFNENFQKFGNFFKNKNSHDN